MKYFLLLSLLINNIALAKTVPKKKNEKNIVDRTHKNISNKITKISEDIDNFFSNHKHEDEVIENNSRLKLTLETRFLEAQGPIMTPDINYQLILPRTEKKLQLVIPTKLKSEEITQLLLV